MHIAAARAVDAGLVDIQDGYMIVGAPARHRLLGHVPQAAGEVPLAQGTGTGTGQAGESQSGCPQAVHLDYIIEVMVFFIKLKNVQYADCLRPSVTEVFQQENLSSNLGRLIIDY